MIPQSLLATYHRLAEKEKECKEKRLKLREQILTQLKNGSKIQPGELTAQRTEHQAMAFTHANLREVLGHEEFQWLCNEVAPVTREYLRVVKSADAVLDFPEQCKASKTKKGGKSK